MALRSLPARKVGFTLIELLTVIVIIAILMTLLLPVVSQIKARADKAVCMSNLKGLYVGTAAYIGQYNHWPQIDPTLLKAKPEDYANQWVAVLEPFGVPRKSWICPTVQRLLGGPAYLKPETARVDYRAMTFNRNPEMPYKWPKQPWFVEVGDFHGNGQLLIQTDGSVVELNSLIVKKQ